jgi:hypothetical protein
VHTDLIGSAGAKDMSQELLAFLQRPRISALIDWDEELRDWTQKVKELGFVGFHSQLPAKSRPARETAISDIEH